MLTANHKNLCYLALHLVTVFVFIGCGKSLIDKEEKFFRKLELNCNCQVSRDYNENATSDFKGGPGWYKLILTYNEVINPDSLEEMSMKVAYELHHSILTDVEYPYGEIKIIHKINEGSEAETVKSFSFNYNNHKKFVPHLLPNE